MANFNIPTTIFDNNKTYTNDQSSINKASIDSNNKVYGDEFVPKFVRGFSASNDISDPTYLGFTFLFDWYYSPLFVGTDTAIANLNTSSAMPINTYNGKIDENNVQGPMPMYNTSFDMSSSMGYLDMIGESVRMNYLRMFAQQLKYINLNMPWYWQGIEGLDIIWESYHNINKAFMGGDDAIITIKTLESIDFRIAGMMQMYNKAVYDFYYRRQVIPHNLLEFDMYIYVADLRVFKKLADTTLEPNAKIPKYDLGTKKSEIIFRLKKCTFVNTSGNTFLNNTSNISFEQSENEIQIQWASAEILSQLPFYNLDLNDDYSKIDTNSAKQELEVNEQLKMSLRQHIEKTANAIATNLTDSGINYAKNYINNLYTRLILGNVYGIHSVNQLTNTEYLNNLANNALFGMIQNKSQENAVLGNIYGGNLWNYPQMITNPKKLGNIFNK